MKRNLLVIAAMVAMIFASCSEEDSGINPDVGLGTGFAYLSIKVDAQPQSRVGSGENAGLTDESMLKSLYLLTFDVTGNIVGIPGSSVFYSMINVSALTQVEAQNPNAVKVSAAAKKLVVIANPGAKLLAAINALSPLSTFTSFNTAIADATIVDIVSANGFTMITGGSETNKSVGDKILDSYVTIGDKIKIVTGTGSSAEVAAKTAAEADRLNVRLERLTSKLIVKEQNGGAIPAQAGASFTLRSWTVDAVNSTCYPFAVKTLIDATHTVGEYTNNFYTQDPNYTGSTGIVYATVDATAPSWSYEPVLPWANTSSYYGWKLARENEVAYVIENTMAASEQKFGNATRLVIKATYIPKDFTQNADWFHWAGTDYKTLADLQAAYAVADASQDLMNACDAFYTKIAAYYTNTGKSGFTATKFEELTQEELDNVANGGEVVKNGNIAVIRWYQKGLCYYYYEIRHDNDPDAAHMAFAKYGVVRNNWYNLMLNTVNGPGTPWYPDINKPGPGDPDPEKPIDTQAGYLGISIEIEPWIIWETGFGI